MNGHIIYLLIASIAIGPIYSTRAFAAEDKAKISDETRERRVGEISEEIKDKREDLKEKKGVTKEINTKYSAAKRETTGKKVELDKIKREIGYAKVSKGQLEPAEKEKLDKAQKAFDEAKANESALKDQVKSAKDDESESKNEISRM